MVTVRLTQTLANNLRTRLFERLARLPMTALGDQRAGDSMFRVLYDVPMAPDLVYQLTLVPFFMLLSGAVNLYLLQYSYGQVAPELVLIAWLTVPAAFLVTFPFSGALRRTSQNKRAAGAATTNAMEESMSSVCRGAEPRRNQAGARTLRGAQRRILPARALQHRRYLHLCIDRRCRPRRGGHLRDHPDNGSRDRRHDVRRRFRNADRRLLRHRDSGGLLRRLLDQVAGGDRRRAPRVLLPGLRIRGRPGRRPSAHRHRRRGCGFEGVHFAYPDSSQRSSTSTSNSRWASSSPSSAPPAPARQRWRTWCPRSSRRLQGAC